MEDFHALCWRAPWAEDALAARFDISVRTLRAYRRHNRPPATIARLAEIYAGRLPWPGVTRWCHVRGRFYRDDLREGFDLDQAVGMCYLTRAAELQAQRIAMLEAELARYRAAPVQYFLEI